MRATSAAPEILHALEALAPTTAVLGNNDFDEYGSRVGRFAHPVIDGVRFLVAHYPRDVQIGFNGCAGLAAGDPIPQVCVHGHTHVELVYGYGRVRHRTSSPRRPFRPRGRFRSAGRIWWMMGACWACASRRWTGTVRGGRGRVKQKPGAFHAHCRPKASFSGAIPRLSGDNACEPSMFSCKRVL
ncbi:MAG: metallophosphoesterase family protein [Eggerthella lenta]